MIHFPSLVCSHITSDLLLGQDFITKYFGFIDIEKPFAGLRRTYELSTMYDAAVSPEVYIQREMKCPRPSPWTPEVKVIIHGVEIEAVVDTGASNSLLTMEVVRKCKLSSIFDEAFKLADSVQGVAGPTKILGTIHLVHGVLQSGNLLWTQHGSLNNSCVGFTAMVIKQCPCPILLGMDFIA